MRRRSILVALTAVVSTVAAGCDASSSTQSGQGSQPSDTFTATVNGTAWTAVGKVSVLKASGNTFAISAAGAPYSMSVEVSGVTKPGTIFVGPNNRSASLILVQTTAGSGWQSDQTGGTGTVTLTVVTENHLAGVFSADARPTSATTTGPMLLTNGSFDVRF